MILYHGSNVAIDSIDLSRSRKGKDFGCGFYLNGNKAQAYVMAERAVKIFGEGKPVVSTFSFDEAEIANKDLHIKIFEDYSEEWAEFVVMNRKNSSDKQAHQYDIVIGPIADDTVGVQIRRFVMGYLSASALVEELRFKGDHAVQYFFGTNRAIELLKKVL